MNDKSIFLVRIISDPASFLYIRKSKDVCGGIFVGVHFAKSCYSLFLVAVLDSGVCCQYKSLACSLNILHKSGFENRLSIDPLSRVIQFFSLVSIY